MSLRTARAPIVPVQAVRRRERPAHQPRPLCVVTAASGSAFVEMGSTKVVCAVHGPRAGGQARSEFSTQGDLLCEVAVAPFATLMRPGGGSTTSGMPSGEVLRTALLSAVQVDTFPKAVLEVYVTVVEDGGSATAAAIVAASLAIADAGVGMYGLVAACEVGVVKASEDAEAVVVVDPAPEEEVSQATMTLAHVPAMQTVTYMQQRGVLDGAVLNQCIQLALDLCSEVHQAMRDCVAASQQQAAPPQQQQAAPQQLPSEQHQ